MGSCASLETGNPPRNGATRNFEYINAFYCWCPPSTSLLQERPSSQFQREVPFPDEERNVPLSGEVYLMGSGVPRNMYTTAHSHGPRHRNQLVQAVSLPRARQTCLLAIRCAWQPDRSKWPVLFQEHLGGRPYHQP